MPELAGTTETAADDEFTLAGFFSAAKHPGPAPGPAKSKPPPAVKAKGIEEAPSVELDAETDPGALDDEPPAYEPADDLSDLSPDDYATSAAQLATEAAEGQDDAEEGEPASQREARYRIRLREAEGQRDAAVVRNEALHLELDALRSVEVLRLAATLLVDARDLMPDGSDLSGLLAPDGTVDPEKVSALARQVISDKPHYARAAATKRSDGYQSGAAAAKPSITWKTAFEPRAT